MAEPAMEELAAVRRLRTDAPVPDHARLTPARQRLLDEIARPRRRYGGWQLRALGAVAAVVAAALLSTLTLRGEHTAPVEPAAPIGPHQWVYVKYQYTECKSDVIGPGCSEVAELYMDPGGDPCTTNPARSHNGEEWNRYDGRWQAFARSNGAAVDVRDRPTGVLLSPKADDALVADLPDDPDAALRLILKQSPLDRAVYKKRQTQAQRDFDHVVDVLCGATTVPADKARTIHRVLTGLAGATEPVSTTDGAGRKVLAFGVDGNFRDYAWERNSRQVLLDPETFAFRGVRWVAGLDYYAGSKAAGVPFVPKGAVVGMATRLRTVVVDKAGERG
ncbi:hypothetical protein ACFV5G_07320 [Streptomyces sp. NPDC059766]|uniref:hypothetical protein n=1 Tax=Streptomyces sp. NPDC059766 TaxID=3346940 RepID=UPI00364DFE99